jgi:hypothetical protein
MIWCSIDPAYMNFSLSILDIKSNFHVNFHTVSNYFKYLEFVINDLIYFLKAKISETDKIGFIIENQLKIHNNINLKLEIYLIASIEKNSYFKSGGIKIYKCPAYYKNLICLQKYNFKYCKIRSIKNFKQIIEPNSNFYNLLKEWTIYSLNFSENSSINIDSNFDTFFENIFFENLKKNFKIKKLTSLIELKKFDDFIDTLLLLDARFRFKFIKFKFK